MILSGRVNVDGRSHMITETFNQDFEQCEATVFNIYWEDYTTDGDYSDSDWRFFVSVVADTERKAQNIFKKWFPSKNARFGTFGGWCCCEKINATSNKFTDNI